LKDLVGAMNWELKAAQADIKALKLKK
jgi:hypothetical protein